MYQSFKSLCLIALLLGSVVSASAQGVSQAATKPDIKKSTSQKSVSANRQSAVTLLKQLITQTNSFPRDDYKSIKIVLFQAEVADTLWDYDEPRARALFANAFRRTDAFEPGTSVLSLGKMDMSLILRLKILRFLFNHDINLAENFVNSIAIDSATPEPGKPFSNAFKAQAILYLDIAQYVAASDPQRAVRLIKNSMNGWIDYKQIRALQALRRSSAILADELFVSLLSTFSKRPTYLTAKISTFAPYVFPDDKMFKKGDDDPDSGATAQSNLVLIYSFLGFVYDNLMKQPVEMHINEPNEFGQSAFAQFPLEDLAPYFDRYMPEKALPYRARIKEISNKIKQAGKRDMFDSEDAAWREAFAMNVEELLKEAEAIKETQETDRLYSEIAAVLAMRDNEFDRALSLCAKIGNENIKSEAISMVSEIAMKTTFKNRDAERAYRYSKTMKKQWNFIHYSIQIASLFIEQNKLERAAEILKAAEKMIPESGDSDSASLKVDLANAAAKLQPEWGFTTMKLAVEAVNQAILTNHSSGGMGISREEIHLPNRFNYEQGFATLAHTDFTRALRLARSFQSKEASLLAQLAICKGILRK